jgi:hypothetical protein
MSKLYLLICECWTGTSYDKEFIEIFKDEEVAHRTAILMQGKTPKCDVNYYVQAVDYYDMEV